MPTFALTTGCTASTELVGRTLWHAGREFSTGYVEAVAVREDQRGRGLGRLVMDHAESVIRDRYTLGGLNAVHAAVPFYAGRGWTPWEGPTAADSPGGLVDTFDRDDRILLFGAPANDGTGLAKDVALICDWRIGDLW
ncbi:GNAT family N-acetyltransferase [Mycobacterium yunnanensis]|uniref:GNAT family N-acetyltransferase n=1 Tax=Mycobacterium yunnanensis TaxID=368477 RepID=A0A9X3C010_9MYCO|nr:GNAT family N-acetyltransferase [Mycobacterium yunnanensis]MCV7420278.1 GNAT family N-acetyltransferase [Mycobacterium yunnanensis]